MNEETPNPNAVDMTGLVDLAQTAEDYEAMPWTEVAGRAVTNLPSSFLQTGMGLVQAVTSPVETAKAIGQAGYGLGSMAYGALGGEQDPQEKERNEALARAMMEPYTSVGGFKKELAENPVGPLSMLLPAGGGAAVKGGQLIGKAGRLASGVPAVSKTVSGIGKGVEYLGKSAEMAGYAVDPASAVVGTGRVAAKYGPELATTFQSIMTGTPDVVFEKAFEAGAARGKNYGVDASGKPITADQIRNEFNNFYSGNGNVVQLSKDIEDVVGKIKNDFSNEWIATRGQITGASNAPIDYSNIFSTLDEAWVKDYGGKPGTKTRAFTKERAALDDAEGLILEYASSPPGAGKNNLAGLDELKRALWAKASDTSLSNTEQNVYKTAHAAVRKTLEDISPEYAQHMDSYQLFLDELNTIKKTMGAGQSVDANTQLARAIKRGFELPGGQSIMEKVAEVNPKIPFQIAGAALGNNKIGLRQVVAGSAAGSATLGPAVMYAIHTQDPIAIMATIPAILGGAIASSPQAMGRTSYGVGRAAAAASAMGDIPLGPVDLGDVVSGAARTARPMGIATEQIQAAKQREYNAAPGLPVEGGFMEIYEPGEGKKALELEIPGGDLPVGQNAGGRVARKSGGRIRGNPISAEVKRVRALLAEKTASMLSVPDDAIATALHIAKRT